MVKISLPYGEERLVLEVSEANLHEVLWPNKVLFPKDPIAEIERALEHPIGTPRLEDLVRPGQRVVIISDDITRPTPVHRVLPLLLTRLNRAGVPDERISVVMALGSHRPMTPAEMDKKLGEEIRRRVPVYNAEFRDKAGLVDFGLAPGGVRVWVDRRVAEAEVRIGIGSIVPHPATGWSGGGKIIYPGVTGEETVTAFHLMHGRTPYNMYGMDKSLVREAMERWVDTVGLHFIVNLVCLPTGEIFHAVAGHYIQAHRAGVEWAKRLYAVKARGKVDIAIVSSHPADADLWQAPKGVMAGEFLVRDGGTLILVTPCPEGVGPHPEYVAYLGRDDLDELLAKVDPTFISEGTDPLALPVAATVARIRKRINLMLVSHGIDRLTAEKAGMEKVDSVEEAVSLALARYGPEAKISVIPFGGEVLPIVEE